MEEKKDNKEKEQLSNTYADNTNTSESQRAYNSGNNDNTPAGDDTDKYLAMEQPGVTYTHDTDPTASSDHAKYGSDNAENVWNSEGGNSKNSEAFNQDDYLLEDNVDLDEDQNQSISSDDEDFEETNERY